MSSTGAAAGRSTLRDADRVPMDPKLESPTPSSRVSVPRYTFWSVKISISARTGTTMTVPNTQEWIKHSYS